MHLPSFFLENLLEEAPPFSKYHTSSDKSVYQVSPPTSFSLHRNVSEDPPLVDFFCLPFFCGAVELYSADLSDILRKVKTFLSLRRKKKVETVRPFPFGGNLSIEEILR